MGIAGKLGLGEEIAKRGWMAVQALRRISKKPGLGEKAAQLGHERRYFDQHQRAARKRRDVDAAMDAMAKVYGVVMGWYLGPNENHCPVCKDAAGKNFFIQKKPRIGWPGTVHGDTCQCSPGAAWPGAAMLP